MGKPRHPRKGERRKRDRKFAIDALPVEVRGHIQALRAGGMFYADIEELSARPLKQAGFVPWDELPAHTLRLFPGRRLPASNLGRWYDVRVEQVLKQVQKDALDSREIANSLLGPGYRNLPESTKNGLADRVFALLKAADQGNQKEIRKELANLGWLLAQFQKNEVAAARVEFEREKFKQLAERVEGLKNKVAGKKKVAPAELQEDLSRLAQDVRKVYEGKA